MKKVNSIKNSDCLKILFCEWGSICEPGIERGFRQLGHQIYHLKHSFSSVDYDTGYLKILAAILEKKRYNFVFSINYIPIISRVCMVYNILYVCWTVDSPCFQLYSNTISNSINRIFMFDKSQYNKFYPCNPKNIFYMPLACDYEELNQSPITNEDHEMYDCDISFIGSTYQEKCIYNQIEKGLTPYLKGYVESLIHAQMNVYGYNLIEDSLTDEFCKEFKKYADWYPLGEDYVEDIRGIVADTYIGQKCTEQERLLTLKNISEKFSIDLYTQSDTSALPKVHHRSPADSSTMMPKIIKCSKINLNMTNRPIRTGLPLRIFDIMGAGGFLLSNYQEEIPEYFNIGEDLAVYNSQENLLAQVEYFLQHDDERERIAKNGQNKVKKLHTYANRLHEIIQTALQ